NWASKMLQNVTFTLYEIFGYLLPGSIALLGLTLLYWAFVLPTPPTGAPTPQVGIGIWVAAAVASYVLGHAVQAIGNKIWPGRGATVFEDEPALNWTLDKARAVLGALLKIDEAVLKGQAKEENAKKDEWVIQTADEYLIQNGKPGDREMYVYREG